MDSNRKIAIIVGVLFIEKVYPLDVGEAVTLDGVTIEGLKAVHGPLIVKFLGSMVSIYHNSKISFFGK
ncbi:MAG: hypothetical protein K8R25_10515 [Methanosarcinales archaeon]|nr:hypothetical protein [Methanosarcinales archaeon]